MTVDPEAVLRWLGQNFVLLLIPYLVWQTNLLRQVSQTVYGVKGDNGLQGYVKELRKRDHDQHNILQRHDGTLERHKERLDAHDHEISAIKVQRP